MNCSNLFRFERGARRRRIPAVKSARATGCALLMLATASAESAESRLADAVGKLDRATVRTLLHEHVDVNAAQVDGMTALHWAAYLDDPEIAKLLIEAGADAKVANRYG